MEVIKNILIHYWPEILAVIFFLGSLILQLIKKKPVSDIQALIFDWALDAIHLAESSDKNGAIKLTIAVQYVLAKLKTNFPDLNVEAYRDGIISIIEDILSTPQKHVDE